MKTAKLLFIGTCIFIVVWPLFRVNSYANTFQRDGQSAYFIEADRSPFLDTVYAEGPVVEEQRKMGFFTQLSTAAGIHLTHDPSMGREVMVKGPANVLRHLTTGNAMNGYRLRFNRPIILPEDVEVRMNLNEHHPGLMRLSFDSQNNRKARFTTLGPVVGKVVTLRGCPDVVGASLQLEADYFFQQDQCGYLPIDGRIEYVQSEFGEADRNYSQLPLTRAKMEQRFPHGQRAAFQADTVQLYYNFAGHEPNDVLKLMTEAPDTLYVPEGTEIELRYRHQDRIPDLDSALLVVQPLAEF